MPYFSLKTNDVIPEGQKLLLIAEIGEAIKCIGKSPSHLMVQIEDGTGLYFAGTNEPCALGDFSLFGRSPIGYDTLVEKLTDAIVNATDIDKNRIFIQIHEVDKWAMGGRLF